MHASAGAAIADIIQSRGQTLIRPDLWPSWPGKSKPRMVSLTCISGNAGLARCCQHNTRHIMERSFRYFLIAILIVVLAVLTVWGALAIWFQLPVPDAARMVIGGSFGVFGCSVILAQFGAQRVAALGVFAFVFAGLLVWWGTIRPSADGNWAPDVARQVTGKIEGDVLTLENVREFDWRSNDDFTPRWTNRTFDLSKLRTLDMFMSYWSGPEMAHFILSFGFEGNEYLAWSVEVRREVGGGFSPVADFFKTNTLAIVATVEQDVVGVRSNVRGENVQMFRLRTPPENARALLKEYVRDANRLAVRPKFYNSVTTNCTTVVFKMMDAVGAALPLDWRLIVNGYLPEYAYDQGALDTRATLGRLRELGTIRPRALAAGLGKTFSTAIRAGVPIPAQ